MTDLFRISDLDAEVLDVERRRVEALIADCVSSELLHEVGSTAIPDVIGKQDLDYLILVPMADFQLVRSRLDECFPRNTNQLSSDSYQGYTVESDLDVAIQLTIEGGPHDNFLSFLTILRSRSDLRLEYNELKRSFDGRPMSEYREAKRHFIERILSTSDGS